MRGKPKKKRQKTALKRAVSASKKMPKKALEWYRRRGEALIEKSIEWAEREGRIGKEKAGFFRKQISEGRLDDFLRGFKAHLLLSGIPVVSAVPFFGSIARSAYTVGARAKARVQKGRGKISEEKFSRAMELHSGKAIAFAALPYVGFLSYVLTNSIRDPELMNIVANYSLHKSVKAPYLRVKVGVVRAGGAVGRYYRFNVYLGKKLVKSIRRLAPPENKNKKK